jgi:hypothetical protein
MTMTRYAGSASLRLESRVQCLEEQKVDVAIILRRESCIDTNRSALMYCSHLSPPTVEDACTKYRLPKTRNILQRKLSLRLKALAYAGSAARDELPFPRKKACFSS